MADYDLMKKEELMKQKKKLLSLLGPKTYKDPVLADPITKEGIQITSNGGTSYKIQSPTATIKEMLKRIWICWNLFRKVLLPITVPHHLRHHPC